LSGNIPVVHGHGHEGRRHQSDTIAVKRILYAISVEDNLVSRKFRNGQIPVKSMKRVPIYILGLCLAALFQGCDHKSSGPANDAPPKKLRLAFVGSNSDDFWSIVRLGCDGAVRQLGDVDLDFRIPANRTAEAQQEILSDLVARGVEGIAISPIDAENQTDFLNHIATNTLLVCADSDAKNSQRACYIGTDNVAAGTLVAKLLKAALPQGGKIILFVGYPNAQNTKDRIQGIQNGLAESNIQIMDTLADGAKSALAQKNAQDALAKYPDLAGMVGIYGYDGPAILTAVRAAGKTGQVKIVCFDENSDTLDGIADGYIYGTIVQKPYEIGRQAIIRMDKYLRGDKTQFSGGAILIPAHAVTKDNVAAFQASLKVILQP
jgi:ribose transport system substrate-binding protein